MSKDGKKVILAESNPIWKTIIAQAIKKELIDSKIKLQVGSTDNVQLLKTIETENPDILIISFNINNKIDRSIKLIKQIKAKNPKLFIIVLAHDIRWRYEIVKAGANDFLVQPPTSISASEREAFLEKVFKKVKRPDGQQLQDSISQAEKILSSSKHSALNKKGLYDNIIIAIGASAGGTDAIYDVVKKFPADFPAVAVVQHMPPVFTEMYAERLNRQCTMKVSEAKDNTAIEPGNIYVAPGGFQCYVHKQGAGYKLKVAKGEKVSGHSPSVDVLFNSVAKSAGKNSIGVILTGMGSDGAKGLLKMFKAGAYTIGQDEKSSVVYGMPKMAYQRGAVVLQLPLDKIAERIMIQVNKLVNNK